MKAPSGVLVDLELSATSSLMADRYKPGSRGAIKRIHSINSIFHLLKKTLGSGGSFSGFAFFLPPKEDFFSLEGVARQYCRGDPL